MKTKALIHFAHAAALIYGFSAAVMADYGNWPAASGFACACLMSLNWAWGGNVGPWTSCDLRIVPTIHNPAYRTRRPLPAKPEPVWWSKPEHVPGPVCWLRPRGNNDSNLSLMVTGINERGVCASTTGHRDWHELTAYEHSTDRVNWFPCAVQ